MNVTSLFSILSGLSSVKRYSMSRLIQPESVLEHTGMVCFIANMLAREINLMLPPEDEISIHVLTLRCLMHDVDELMTGDIPRPTKYRSEKTLEMFREIARWGVSETVSSLEMSSILEAEMERAHEFAKEDPEGLIVAVADTMCVAQKIWEEVLMRGNHAMVSHASAVMKTIEELRRRTSRELGEVSGSTSLVFDVLGQCEEMMYVASRRENPMLGARGLRR